MDIDKDTLANTVSLTGMTLSLMNIETIVTLAVLLSALVLNITRIIEVYKNKGKSDLPN